MTCSTNMVLAWSVAALLLLLLLLHSSSALIASTSASASLRLYAHLFLTYRPSMRPRLNDSHTVDLAVHLYFKQILKVDEIDQLLTVHCWLELFWRDEYLVWQPANYDNISSITVPARLLWRPDLLVYNNANMNVAENELETNAIVSSEGRVMLFRSVITEVTCKLDMTYFPFDEQACKLMLASWAHDGSRINVTPFDNGDDALSFYQANSEWILQAYKIRKNTKVYDCCPEPYPDVTFYFIIARNPGYYLTSLIIPSAFIALVTVVGFFTPHSSTGENTEKVSLGVTALLSMAIIMMMVANEMPATTNVLPVIGLYYIGVIMILFSAAVSSTLTLSTQMKGLSGRPPGPNTKWVFFGLLARCRLVTCMLPELDDRERWHCFARPAAASAALKSQPTSATHCTTTAAASFDSQMDVQRRLVGTGSGPGRAVDVELTTSNRSAGDGDSRLDATSQQLLHTIHNNIQAIRLTLDQHNTRRQVIREWRQIARILERVLMLCFVVLIISFAYVVLTMKGTRLQMDDALMDELSRA